MRVARRNVQDVSSAFVGLEAVDRTRALSEVSIVLAAGNANMAKVMANQANPSGPADKEESGKGERGEEKECRSNT